MKVIAFYSYKGGVGRTLAATNFAVYLAKLGLRVVIIDFDLDAPGLDSKFPTFDLPSGQVGLIDYILRFQRSGTEPGPIGEILCTVRIPSPRREYTLGLIPAGDYLATDYSAKLNELNWSEIFSERRDGVAFFQLFLTRIEEELTPDVVIIDSRTGFSEIGGLCTQQLANETVIISSLAKESIKMTRHLARIIRGSQIAKSLKKEVETKIVVSRVPKPKDPDKLKARCCKLFDVDETKLFFLFSCPGLEREEFVAMLDTSKEDTLVANYTQLFQGLDVEIAQESIAREIAQVEQGLLSSGEPEVADARVREMVALYPHAQVYRRAMRYFNLTRRPEEAAPIALRLLDLAPDDNEAQLSVARFLLRNDPRFRHQIGARHGQLVEGLDVGQLLTIAVRAVATGSLSIAERVRLADMLEDVGEFAKSYDIARSCLESGEIDDPEVALTATILTARTAMRMGKTDEAGKLVLDLPVSRLRGSLAHLAMQVRLDAGDKEGAFDLAKSILMRTLVPGMIERGFALADELRRRPELDEAIRGNPELEAAIRHNPQIVRELEQHGVDVVDLRGRSRRADRH